MTSREETKTHKNIIGEVKCYLYYSLLTLEIYS